MRLSILGALAVASAFATAAAFAQQAPPTAGPPTAAPQGPGGAAQAQAASLAPHGEELFVAKCKSCHDPAVDRAPNKNVLAGFNGEVIINALSDGGMMQPMAAGMSADDIRAVAVYLTGRAEMRPAFDTANEASN